MKKNDERVFLLYDAISELDPRLVSDALSYRRSGVRKRRTFVTLVAALLAFSVMLSLAVGLMRGDKNKSDGMVNPGDDAPSFDSENGKPETSLEKVLAKSTRHKSTDASKLDVLDSGSALVWQYSGESKYCVLGISSSMRDTLLSLIPEDSENKIDPSTDKVSVRVWIICGDGSVVSPYLRSSDGNVAYGSLFDYNPEIEPDEKFVKQVEKLIG